MYLYKYHTELGVKRKDLQKTLEKWASEGWKLVSKEVSGTVGAQRMDQFDLIFEFAYQA